MSGVSRSPEPNPTLDEVVEELEHRAPGSRAAIESATSRRRLIRILSELRKAAPRKQSQLASSMGTSQPAIARLEAGDTDPRLSTVERYAAALGFRLDWRLVPASHQVTPEDGEFYAEVLGRDQDVQVAELISRAPVDVTYAPTGAIHGPVIVAEVKNVREALERAKEAGAIIIVNEYTLKAAEIEGPSGARVNVVSGKPGYLLGHLLEPEGLGSALTTRGSKSGHRTRSHT